MKTKTGFYAAQILKDAKKGAKERRFRNILANSGEIMESGEIRDIEHLYVMGRDAKLYKIADLDTDPDKQAEDYTVKAQADHGQVIGGELVPSMEKQFGSCKVWLEEDGLHARMYFADNDALADHAYAISEDASYSTGIDWFPDGYYGAGYEINDSIGILREISMVLTGNDPRAKTIDAKSETANGVGMAAGSADSVNKLSKKGNSKMGKTFDELTQDEGRKMAEEIYGVIDKFTTDVPESETEPTARDTKDAEGGTGAETEAEVKTNDSVRSNDKTLHQNVVIIKDRVAKQERSVDGNVGAYLKSEKAVAAWGQALLDARGAHGTIASRFARIAKTRDDVDFGSNVNLAPEAVINAVAEQLNDGESLMNLAFKTGLKYEVVAVPTSEDSARGHVRNKTKIEEDITGKTRVLTPEDLYKLMRLNHSMVELNGGLGSSAIVRYVLRELPRKLREAIDQGILVGGIANDDNKDAGSATKFSNLIAVTSDISDGDNTFATTFQAAGTTLTRADISKAAARVRSGANRTLVMTQDAFTDLENSTTGTAGIPMFPNGIDKSNPNINGIARIVTPLWLTQELLGNNLAVVVDFDAYHLVGNTTPETLTDYAIDTNKYVWEVLACIGGGLANANSAVGITAGE